jgi:hypothetical protein
MPEVTRDELGRRIFQINKEKAVESAVEKIRQALGSDWDSLTSSDIAILHDLLGELWIAIGRNRWDEYVFSGLKKKEVQSIISIGVRVKQKNRLEQNEIDEVDGIFRASE